MAPIELVFIVAALICFGLKALGVPVRQVDLVAGGFAFLTATLLV